MRDRCYSLISRLFIAGFAALAIVFSALPAKGDAPSEESVVLPHPSATPESQWTSDPPGVSVINTAGDASIINAEAASSAFVEQLVWLVNQYRAKNNLPPLKADPSLSKAAQDYAERMGKGNFFGHSDPDFICNRPSDRAVAAGYLNWSTIGENLAAGYSTPESAFNALTQSPGHNDAMLNLDFREIGIGYYFDPSDAANVRQNGSCPYSGTGGPYRHYWAQEFGARNSNGLPVLPVIINSEAVSTTQRQVNLYIYGGVSGNAWAQQMRFSEDGQTWSAYEPYAPNKQYTLPAGTGTKTIYVQVVNGVTSQTMSDSIWLQDGAPNPNVIPRVFIPIVRR